MKIAAMRDQNQARNPRPLTTLLDAVAQMRCLLPSGLRHVPRAAIVSRISRYSGGVSADGISDFLGRLNCMTYRVPALRIA